MAKKFYKAKCGKNFFKAKCGKDLQKILSFEVRSIPYPKVVFAANEHWSKDGKRDEGLLAPIPERIDDFVESFPKFVSGVGS